MNSAGNPKLAPGTALVTLFLSLALTVATSLQPNPCHGQSVTVEAVKGQVVINQVDVSAFPNVMLYVSVFDDSGRLNLGLSPQDFTVKEDEVEQSPVNVKTQLPSIASALVVDSSGSMKSAMPDTQRAATTYIDKVRQEDEIAVIDFSDKVRVSQKFTTDKDILRKAVRGIKARGNTALYDAIFEATQSFGAKKGRKVIILLTDGRDDDGMNRPLSAKTVDQAIAAANEVNVPVFTIGLGSSVDESLLRRIAEQTGGRYFLSPGSADLESLYKEIGAQLEGQYVITYATNLADADGSWHRVVVTAKSGLGQKQYKAPLDQSTQVTAPPPAEKLPVKAEANSTAKSEDKPKINVLASSQGTKVVFATSQYDTADWAAKNLIDEAIGDKHQYCSAALNPQKITPQEIVLELPKVANVTEIIVDPFSTESRKRWAKDCELWVSTSDPFQDFVKVLDFTLENTGPQSQDPAYSLTEQNFSFEPAQARWVRVVFKSNHGGDFIQASEVKLMGYFTEEAVAGLKLKNVLAAENGGKLVYTTTQYDDGGWAARNLIDGKLGAGHEFCTQPNTPAEMVFVLPKPAKITQVAFNPYTSEDPKRWAKEVEVQVSTEGPRQGFKSVGKFALHNRQSVDPDVPLPDQVFKIDAVDAKFVKLRLISSHGGEYIQMGEFKVYSAEP